MNNENLESENVQELKSGNEITLEPAETQKDNTASVLNDVPPEQIRWGLYDEIGVFGVSLQGRSHKRTGAPCQDSNNFYYLDDEKILIAAIADGVGSCSLSHWGAYTAVQSAISSLREGIKSIANGNPLKIETLSTNQIEELFGIAFSNAQKAVENLADNENQPVFNFQSTLTVALYDGSRLACCHIGDDGIVAQGTSGRYQMVTKRIKGDEANSVVTLQSGKWFITTTSTEVTGFLMSTDGILDFYVLNEAMNNRVFYPFFETFIYGMEPKQTQDMASVVEQTMKDSCTLLEDDKIMGSVTDDMTILAVANQRLICQAVHPTFSIKEWNTERQRVLKMQQEKLHPKTPKVTPPPVSSNKQTAGKQPVAGETSMVKKKADPSASGKYVRNVSSRDIYGMNTGSQSSQPDKQIGGRYAINDADASETMGFAKRVDSFFDNLQKSLFGVITDDEHVESYTYGYFIDNYSHNSKPKRRNNYCVNCRNKLDGKEKFCPNCGVPIK